MLFRITALLNTPLLMVCAAALGESQQPSQATVKYTAKLAASVQCLNEINTVQEAARLSHFTQATEKTQLTAPDSNDLVGNSEWRKICEHLMATQEANYQVVTEVENPFKDGTYAFKSLTDAQPSCNETLDYWKAAFKNFTILSLSKSQANGLYDKQDNGSFVALYNPSSTATAECRIVTCTKTTSSTVNQRIESEAEVTTEYGYALICKTMPAALADENSAPFTQQQWDGIISSLTGSASVAVPELVGIFIVALGMVTL
ncbi:SAG family member [Eimeria tenella]|uniref:SAG family member n=1 Tax=Eimeria tenella TaxID=5802 RepID=U6KR49_EIMTE|nr:SAG family member [Eimeria tenella]CDJ40597.1 SAG family member [Eimeria tenella]|eukprot:XP_013231347.1 SAG family member [Eimeria tenella]